MTGNIKEEVYFSLLLFKTYKVVRENVLTHYLHNQEREKRKKNSSKILKHTQTQKSAKWKIMSPFSKHFRMDVSNIYIQISD